MKRNGFTLVELLIVVAIIGVLSTIGVPTFRKMIRKAKQAEAKTSLGGLYRAEQAFFAEHDVYGSNIIKMGFELEGISSDGSQLLQNGRYSVGFSRLLNTCHSCFISTCIVPDAGSPEGLKIRGVSPQYYLGTFDPLQMSSLIFAQGKTLGAGFCRSGKATSTTFIAAATGAIDDGVDQNTATSSQMDQWTISHDRVLANQQCTSFAACD